MGERADDLKPAEEMQAGSDEIECHVRNIEETRADMSQTLDAIQERLQPSYLMSQARAATRERVEETMDTVRQKARVVAADVRDKAEEVRDVAFDASGRVVSFARQNAVPLLLTAAGTFLLVRVLRSASDSDSSYQTWSSKDHVDIEDMGLGCGVPESAMESDVRQSARTSSPGLVTRLRHRAGDLGSRAADRAGSMKEKVRDNASHIGERLQDAAGSIGERVGQMGSSLREQATDMASSLRHRAVEVGGRVRSGASRAGSSMRSFYFDNPLAAGAVCLSLGLGSGLLVPMTAYENRLMGETRDELLQQAQERAHDLMERAQEGAGQVVERVQEAAQEAMSEARDTLVETETEATGARQGLQQPSIPGPIESTQKQKGDRDIKITIGPGKLASQQPPTASTIPPPPTPGSPVQPVVEPVAEPHSSHFRNVNAGPSNKPEPPRVP